MSTCPQCGAIVVCGMEAADPLAQTNAPCWCQTLPPAQHDWLQRTDTARAAAQCLCRECLQAITESASDVGASGKDSC